MTRLCLFALVSILLATPAYAQLCRGGPSFASFPYQVGASASFSDGSRSAGGDFAVGGRYVFAGAGATGRFFDDADGSAAEISGRLGLEVRVSESRRVFFCPAAFVSFGSGPDLAPTEVSTFNVGGGGRVGVVVHDAARLQLVPTFGVDAVRERRAIESGGAEIETTDGYGLAALGVGIIVNGRLGITPEVGVPFSAANADVLFTVRVTFGFGP